MKRLVTILLVFLTISGLAQKKPAPLPQFLLGVLEIEDKPLYALKRISVSVEIKDMPQAEPSVDSSAVRVAIELALRKAGLTIVTPINPDLPVLFFTVQATKIKEVPIYTNSIRLSLVDMVTILRSKDEPKGIQMMRISTFVEIWKEEQFGAFGFKQVKPSIEEAARKLTDSFLNDWLAQNQK